MSFSNTIIKVPIIILGCHAILNLFRGSIHLFLPEGGSVAIAGLDIGNGDQRKIIISIFATLGASQIVWSALQIYVLFYAKKMVPLILTLTTILTGMGVIIIYVFKPLPITAPAHNNVYILILLIIATVIAFQNQPTKDYL
tara:strand:+ start:1077 stop:1499 length:423 start_codon:yes stop_codon:yes gene_type:complete